MPERRLPEGATPGLLTLVGAGELMPAMSSMHREALSRLAGAPRPVLLDTTAGYESNIDAIVSKAVEYYALRLQSELKVASYRHAGRATATDTARAIAEVRAANFVFAGPGSPTYALSQWRGSPMWEALVDEFIGGTHLLFASAASITLGRYSLPVYEIFKAGRDPYWEDGLDLLGLMGLNLAVVPHYNDNSGGENYDSRFCYMGAIRYERLQEQLPDDVTILGIDEYTAIRFDALARSATVTGQGGVTIIAEGNVAVHPAGTVLTFEAFHSSHRAVVRVDDGAPRAFGYEYAEPAAAEDATAALHDYVETLDALDTATRVELLAKAEAALRSAAPAEASNEGPLMELLLEMRRSLRAAKQWELADKLRDALVDLGYEIQDSKDGSTWQRR